MNVGRAVFGVEGFGGFVGVLASDSVVIVDTMGDSELDVDSRLLDEEHAAKTTAVQHITIGEKRMVALYNT